MILITLGLTAAGLTAVIMITFVRPLIDSPLGQLATGALSVFVLGTFASQWIANWLVSQRPQRQLKAPPAVGSGKQAVPQHRPSIYTRVSPGVAWAVSGEKRLGTDRFR